MVGPEGIELKSRACEETFDRLYQMHGVEVTWAKHPPSTLTEKFVARVLARNSDHPLVYDLGCGEGGKAFSIARHGIRVRGFDTSGVAIEIARQHAIELDMSERVRFEHADIVFLNPTMLDQAEGVHDYQCINHIPKEHYPGVAKLINDLLLPEGVYLTNAFSRRTTNFYGEDVSNRENGEFIFRFDPNNSHHAGRQNVDGMYCYFFSEGDLRELYSPYFRFEELIEVPHPFIDGRFHWEVLMTKKK